MVAIDGEWSLYEEAARHLPKGMQKLFHLRQRSGSRETECVGTVVVADPDNRRLLIATDATGTFPIYLCEYAGGLLYSSLLRPLAKTVDAKPDDISALEFLRQGYTVGERTLFSGIRRLLPGQVALFADGHLSIQEQSQAWVGTEDTAPLKAAELAWDRLVQVVGRSIPPADATLMMSGGWDSRTVLAATCAAKHQIDCYSHGDVASRELELVRSLCYDAAVACEVQPIDVRVLDLHLLQLGFRRTENVVFPHWHYSGRLLANRGTPCVTAGVYGEILGGHYGTAMLTASPLAKIASVASMLLLGRSLGRQGNGTSAALDALRVSALPHSWYLKREYEMSLRDPLARMNEAIHNSVVRLERRGIIQPEVLVEAFISEHRGTQYINAQLRSVRGWTNVAVPFAGGEIFTLATRIPIAAKIHNSLNRRMLALHAPSWLDRPMAATLAPARAPILVQEASRAVRKAFESLHRGKIRRRLGWVNFEFLRDGRALRAIVDDLRMEVWDKKAMHQTIGRVAQEPTRSMHPMFDQLSKILTVDMMFR